MSSKIVQTEAGGPEVLELVEVDESTVADLAANLAADEVLVRVSAASVNPVDAKTRSGAGMLNRTVSLPLVPGWDLAGKVEAVGSGVTSLAVGERVFGLARFPAAGEAYADYSVVPAVDLVPTPASLSDLAAAALPMAAMTAWQAFVDTTPVGPGQRVLITGAGGGVGHLAVQIAHHLGATVIAVASEGKHEWLRGLGADVTVDYRDEAAMAALAEEPVDVAYSLVAGSAEAALAAVKRGGVFISLGGGSATLPDTAESAGVKFATSAVHTERAWIEQVAELAATGALVPTIGKVFDLADAAAAHRAIEAGHTTGKIVLRMSAANGAAG